jgi:uncharacterized protein YaeQ
VSDEPALWQKDLTGQLETWIEVGLPSEDKVKKASVAKRAKAIKRTIKRSKVSEGCKASVS